MPVVFSNTVRVINPSPSPRNSPRSSVTPRTRQSGRDSRSPKTHSRGRKRKTKVKKAKRSKRGSQKKRGRRASRRQRGGESVCSYAGSEFMTELLSATKGGRTQFAEYIYGFRFHKSIYFLHYNHLSY